ncbi:putative mitochondrial carrier domain superfamily [Helianthus annuus]|nr:putative mitochondrial carrier domain superfamily [Helianthus annuus]
MVRQFNQDAELTPVLRLGAGACAGIIAMSATYPMDLVRGRLTVQTDKSPSQYRGIAHALATVLREEGPRALYKGWLPSVIGVLEPWVKPLLILLMSSAEECKWLAGNTQLLLSPQMANQHSSTPVWLMLSGKPFVMKRFGALYKGLVPNSVKVVPSIAIAFVSYEVVKDLLG